MTEYEIYDYLNPYAIEILSVTDSVQAVCI